MREKCTFWKKWPKSGIAAFLEKNIDLKVKLMGLSAKICGCSSCRFHFQAKSGQQRDLNGEVSPDFLLINFHDAVRLQANEEVEGKDWCIVPKFVNLEIPHPHVRYLITKNWIDPISLSQSWIHFTMTSYPFRFT